MGVGPYHLRPGDRVAIFACGVTPYIIREAGADSYTLVGDAYIHGRMDEKASMLHLEDITLL